jgi:DUF4097 and DUF4098 domain-containing protein YvlB
VLLPLVVGALMAATVTFSATDRQIYTVPLPATRVITVDITVGHVRIQGEPRSDAVIEVVRTAPTAAGLARIPVVVDQSDAEVRIHGVQRDEGTDPTFKTDVTLRVPHRATLKSVRVVEGGVTLSALSGAVTADIRRGPIDAVNLEGVVRLETGIGNVTARAMRLSENGLLRLRTFNGDVQLTLAERPADARIMALALNGSIQSEIPLRMRDTWGPRWGEAILGKGEPVISIDVVTGRIDINVGR